MLIYLTMSLLFTQGFRKVDPDRWEFANEGFLRGQRHLLKTIKRRKPPSYPPPRQQNLDPCLEAGCFGFDGEIDRLERDKNILMAEVVKLRQEQQTTRDHLQDMEERLHNAEQKQQQMMGFLARAMWNPDFLQQLLQLQERRKELEEAISKKRRRPIDRVPYHGEGETSENQDFKPPFGIETEEMGSFYGPDVSELESLALEIQGLRENKEEEEEEEEEPEEKQGRGGEELNDDFWEELLNEGIGEKDGSEGRDDLDDVNILAEKLGFLSSSSPK